MSGLRDGSGGHGWRSLVVATVLLVTCGCDRPATPQPVAAAPDGMRTFTGSWSATGTRQTLPLAAGHQAAVFKVSGSLLLSGQQRPHLGFRAEVIGFSDSLSGVQARSVWTDEHGDKVFSELRGAEMGPGKVIAGRFIGGTGRYAGVSGEYTFRWQYLTDNEEGEVSGRVVGLSGWARLGSPLPTTTGGAQ
jgi:hypothetical protein